MGVFKIYYNTEDQKVSQYATIVKKIFEIRNGVQVSYLICLHYRF